MIITLRLVSSLLLSVSFLMIGIGGLSTIIAYRMGMAEQPAWVVGAVTSMYFVGLVLGAGFCHRIISNVGHIRAFAAFGSLISAATLAHALTVDPWLWGLLRFLVGFITVGMYMCTESWLNEKSSNQIRGQVFSLYQVVLYLAQGAGQFLIMLPDPSGTVLFVVVSMTLSLAIVPVAMTRVSAPALPEPVKFDLRRLWKISPTGMTTGIASGGVMGGFYGLGALYAHQIGLEAADTSTLMGAIIFGGLLLQWPIGKLSDRIDRRLVMLGVGVGTALVCLVIVFAGSAGGIVLFSLGALFGGLSFTLYPLAVAYTNDYLSQEDLVPISGGLMMSYGIGASFGPVAGSLFMGLFGAGGLFIYISLVSMILVGVIAWRITQREALPVDAQGGYQTIQRTSSVVYELYPESESAQSETDQEQTTLDKDAKV